MQPHGPPRTKGRSIVASALLLVAADADAAGLFVYEMATPDLSTAWAGRAAAALLTRSHAAMPVTLDPERKLAGSAGGQDDLNRTARTRASLREYKHPSGE